MSMTRRAVPLEVARAVLWHYGDTNLGIEPGGFFSALILAISRADPENRDRLRASFPQHVIAVEAVKTQPWGLDWLRGLVKAELDGVELGLDFGVPA